MTTRWRQLWPSNWREVRRTRALLATLFCQVCDLFCMEEAMRRMVTEQGIFEAGAGARDGAYPGVLRASAGACGEALPILCLGDDFATQRG